MKVVLQRVLNASVVIDKTTCRTIEKGLLLLLGVAEGDTAEDAALLARKCAQLRIFEDDAGKLNISAQELGLDAMIVSNFTLCADTKKGRRPGFAKAAKQPASEELYEHFVACMRDMGLHDVQTGAFGADMQISLINDGPITLVLDTEEWKQK
ncbi:MAG: D-aminoacyl-tRNA deacylase [Oscillospiraceae bacterium]|nr:D-aminoacyl-tRNA deacylase [Oscillospiraceae bacterium]